jgi:UDP-3-O-acyl-N-acetylglucosamine deacetylase
MPALPVPRDVHNLTIKKPLTLDVLVRQVVTVQDGDSFISLYPSDELKITYGLNLEEAAPVIGKQWFTWVPSNDPHYRWHISPARTFYTSLEVCMCALPSFHASASADCESQHGR